MRQPAASGIRTLVDVRLTLHAGASHTAMLRDHFLASHAIRPQLTHEEIAALRALNVGDARYVTRQRWCNDVSLSEELRLLLGVLWRSAGDATLSAYAPSAFFTTLWKFVPRFRGFQQQDAHEFLRFLLDRICMELSSVAAHEGTDAPPVSIVQRAFQGVLLSEVRCLHCQTISRKRDPFLDLSVDIPDVPVQRHTRAKRARRRACQLSECLEVYMGLERLAESERYFCTVCARRCESTKKFTLDTLPPVCRRGLRDWPWPAEYVADQPRAESLHPPEAVPLVRRGP